MSHSDSDKPASPADGDPVDAHHVVSPANLLGVYALLVVFTAITVGVSRIDLGNYNILVALAVAVVKGSLVLLYFMHLRWDSPFNALAIIAALLFVCLFIGLALLDSNAYQSIIKATP
jgi:cytochrome c oxidase subunit 4